MLIIFAVHMNKNAWSIHYQFIEYNDFYLSTRRLIKFNIDCTIPMTQANNIIVIDNGD